MPRSEILVAERRHRSVLWRLLQLYLHDFSEIDGIRLNDRGEYEYRYFDAYWSDPSRTALLFRVGGEWAGFALIRRGSPNQVAEFFIARKFRRRGFGQILASECFKRFPGSWSVHEAAKNDAATAFWRAVIPSPFDEARTRGGVTQRFQIDGASRARTGTQQARSRGAASRSRSGR